MPGWYGVGGAGSVTCLVMALGWVGLLLFLLWGIGHLFPRERRADRDVARDVVQRRYAAGELSVAEYQQAMRALGGE